MTIITTPRFTLRPIRDDDAPEFARLCNDIAIARNTARVAHPYTLQDAHAFTRMIQAAFAAGTEYAFAVTENAAIIACAGIMPRGEGVLDLGYWVAAEARGKGAATEAAGAAALFAFERCGAESLIAGYFTDNPASGRVLAKLGFKPTGETANVFSVGRGVEAEAIRMALARADFAPPAYVRFA